jgi:hypothetical protein
MTTRTPQCEVFWPFNSSSEFSGVPEDSKFPLLGMWASPPHLAQSGVATIKLAIWLPTFFFAITYILGVQMGHVSPFQTSKFQELSNDIRNFSIQWMLTLEITLWRFKSPLGFQLPKLEFTWECGGSFPHTFSEVWNVTFGFHSWLAP